MHHLPSGGDWVPHQWQYSCRMYNSFHLCDSRLLPPFLVVICLSINYLTFAEVCIIFHTNIVVVGHGWGTRRKQSCSRTASRITCAWPDHHQSSYRSNNNNSGGRQPPLNNDDAVFNLSRAHHSLGNHSERGHTRTEAISNATMHYA